MKVYSYRYMWQFENSDVVNFKIVTDVSEGLKKFEDELLLLDGLCKAMKEYVQEYDCSLIGKIDVLKGGK